MPWKNGGGVTTEIAVFPEAAGLDDFEWRLSMATVATDGPFSLFAGVDRTLAVLDGEGIVLSVDGMADATLTPASPPFAFRGRPQRFGPIDLRPDHRLQRHDAARRLDASMSSGWRFRERRFSPAAVISRLSFARQAR